MCSDKFIRCSAVHPEIKEGPTAEKHLAPRIFAKNNHCHMAVVSRILATVGA
jgi:hypothetical protein